MPLHRRDFLRITSLSAASGAFLKTLAHSAPMTTQAADTHALKSLASSLLERWCKGMLQYRIRNTGAPTLDGGFICPACSRVHGRTADAIYPYLYLAKAHDDERYIDVAKGLYQWREENVSMPNGCWVNDVNVGGWAGTTVFAVISLVEALKLHGDLLDRKTRQAWEKRAIAAGDWLIDFIYYGVANINYPLTAVYAFALLGEYFDRADYRLKGKELADGAKDYVSPNSRLIFGEIRPNDRLGPHGDYGVDIGYNVEESIPALAAYALLTEDLSMLDLVTELLRSHLVLMLPDGAWDNSFGSRNYKWTYYGSRTSDGCIPAYGLLYDRDPSFYSAALANTRLLESCTTSTDLLAGGPHYESNGVAPCIHHSFCHAKALAAYLDHEHARGIEEPPPLPRDSQQGILHLQDIRTWLVATGPWRATITAAGAEYTEETHATGGALALLWHLKAGPVSVSSINRYRLIEAANMQMDKDPFSMPLTPRAEILRDEVRYHTAADKDGQIEVIDDAAGSRLRSCARLVSSAGEAVGVSCSIDYRFADGKLEITAAMDDAVEGAIFILPIVSPSGESVAQPNDKEVLITRANGARITVSSTNAIQMLPTSNGRIFNHVPGMEAVPLAIALSDSPTTITITVV